MKRVWIVCAHLVLLGFIMGALSSCSASLNSENPAEWPGVDWASSMPEEQGMSSEVLVEMLRSIEAQGLDLHSLLVVRNGELVLEAYWHPYGPDDVHTIQSITKSVIGMLIGIAIERGEIDSVDARMVDFFPASEIENIDDQKRSITLGHLLSMTSGLDCEDQKVLESALRSEDWVQYFLDRPMRSEPGTEWTYCSGSAHLLSAILQGATGQDARSYANQHLFTPLDIPEVPEPDWQQAPGGVTDGIAGLYLTPRDLARLGYLNLHDGSWDQRQVLSPSWVKESTIEQVHIGPDPFVAGRERAFGYMWSIFPGTGLYGYLGMAGQELFVIPDEGITVVFTGALPVGEEGELLTLIEDFILPSVAAGQAVSVNVETAGTLESLLREAETPAEIMPKLPPKALEVSDAHYRLTPNYLGWPDMTFVFEPGTDTALLKMEDSPDLTIGLDNHYRLNDVPETRPVGLRGEWIDADTFFLDYIIFGEFIHSVAHIRFLDESIILNIDYLNFATPSLSIRGERE